ncbi:MAG: hypothetical protein MAG795_01260 [Candidatus Woesearchaeota archaeon]|nr:hypothetical protein [Candidatus Woesearchaeota archaeon]
MKKIIFGFLIVSLVLLVAGCGGNTPICGDGTCTIDEDALNNCPEDCDRTVDLQVKEIGFGGDVLAHGVNEFIFTVENNGYVPAEFIGELRIYYGDRQYLSRTITTTQENGKLVVKDGANFVLKEEVYIGSTGNWRAEFEVSAVNKEDSDLINNELSEKFTSVPQSYPNYLIEKDFGELEYSRSSRSIEQMILGLEDNNGVTYRADYYGSYAYAEITEYKKEFSMFDFRDELLDQYGERRMTLEEYEGSYLYILEEDSRYQSNQLTVFWMSGKNKVVKLYLSGEDYQVKSFIELLEGYIEMHSSSLSEELTCGNSRCDRTHNYLRVGQSTSFNDIDIGLASVDDEKQEITLNVSGSIHSLERNEILMLDEKYVQVQNLGVRSYERCKWPKYTRINYNVTNATGSHLNCFSELNVGCRVDGTLIKPTYISNYKEPYVGFTAYLDSPNIYQSMRVGEKKWIGKFQVELLDINGTQECTKTENGHLNLGENFRTCPADCET